MQTITATTEKKNRPAYYDRRVCLKIKIKNLADEARTIRREEKKGHFLRNELRAHRIHTVRRAARHTLLAYGFIRGREYRASEGKPNGITDASRAPEWGKVRAMVEQYGAAFGTGRGYAGDREETAKILNRFEEWKRDAIRGGA